MKFLYGNTYEHKEIIKSKGGKWHAQTKAWQVPDEVHAELDALCSKPSTQKKTYTTTTNSSRRFECCDCGDIVYSGSNCWETGLTH